MIRGKPASRLTRSQRGVDAKIPIATSRSRLAKRRGSGDGPIVVTFGGRIQSDGPTVLEFNIMKKLIALSMLLAFSSLAEPAATGTAPASAGPAPTSTSPAVESSGPQITTPDHSKTTPSSVKKHHKKKHHGKKHPESEAKPAPKP